MIYIFLLQKMTKKYYVQNAGKDIAALIIHLNLSMHYVEKWSSILWKSGGMNIARFLKYVCPFISIMHGRVNSIRVGFFLIEKVVH